MADGTIIKKNVSIGCFSFRQADSLEHIKKAFGETQDFLDSLPTDTISVFVELQPAEFNDYWRTLKVTATTAYHKE